MISYLSRGFTKVFGSRNERLVKSYMKRVELINTQEAEVRRLTDAQLRDKTAEFRKRCRDGEKITAMLPQVLAAGREVMDRSVGVRNIFNPQHAFDVNQLSPDAKRIYEQIQGEITSLEPQAVVGGEPAPAWMQVDVPIVLYEAVRALYPKSKPPFRARPFDVQLVGAMVLAEGRIAEMKTGEGKTIVAPLACYLAAVESHQCHVVTVNDYLVQRDRDWVFPFYYWTGLTVGAIHPYHMQPPPLKTQAYTCDTVYGTNSEFGFDYLRDNMKLSVAEQVQKRRDFCIVDEIDSILIDEARTPLIISGPAHEDSPRYELADQVARHLMQVQREWDGANDKAVQCQMRIKGLEGDIRNARDKSAVPALREQLKEQQQQLPSLEEQRDRFVQYYEVEMEKKASHLTHEGVAEAQKAAGVGSFYVGANMDMPHLLENALRSHVVYKRDKDYVVQNGEVVIVDENTGRLMIGRQWSDGLHQAVESKEKVKIKQETQTLATVTIQNFFKLYKRLSGMTGTALTEQTEFHEIYGLEVVAIPTNVTVIREDRNDLIYLRAQDKWFAILDEIRHVHDVGRPVLVGTTSVEKSEMLSGMLTKRTGVKHEVLNAKQHEREAHIVEHAGKLGAVMIATNMAGRGTDIRLAPIERAELVRHWQLRNFLPRQADSQMSDQELINLAHRHQAKVLCGLKDREVEALSDSEARLRCLRHWVDAETYVETDKTAQMSEDDCLKLLDEVPNFLKHRLQVFKRIEQMGGLHIVGTERHEARRIDNQLRGRAGRQGDKGSSRFFISLEDDLMKLFAGPTTMKALSRLGMKEGDAIEHRWITKSVERAQRKVEERNFEIRKNLLEYDEVMEYQRHAFYSIRQEVLEGRNIETMIFDYIGQAVSDAVAQFLARGYVQEQIAEWCRSVLDVNIDPARLPLDDRDELIRRIRTDAAADVQQAVEVTLGEYMSEDIPAQEWNLKGLSAWAMSRFSVDLKVNQLRRMGVEEVAEQLIEAAMQQVEKKELAGVEKFLDSLFGETELARWVEQKFAVNMAPKELADITAARAVDRLNAISDAILEKARQAYRRREVRYPVDFILDVVAQAYQQNPDWAAEQMCEWVRQRFDLPWTAESVAQRTGQQLHDELMAESSRWLHDGKLEQTIDEALAKHGDKVADLGDWAEKRFAAKLEAADLSDESTRRDKLIEVGRLLLRRELTQLERYVLLQILDQAWKDHLYEMDRLKDSINLVSFAEKDPRIAYKKEGAELFRKMQQLVRDRVTELIFRARLTPQVQAPKNVYRSMEARHDQTVVGGLPGQQSEAAQAGSDEQQADLQAAQGAGGGDDDSRLSRRQRRARARRAGHDDPDEADSTGKGAGKRFKKRKRR